MEGLGKIKTEVMIFMDNCFSGNFNHQMQQFLREQNYPTVSAIPAKATRVISFTSSIPHSSDSVEF